MGKLFWISIFNNLTIFNDKQSIGLLQTVQSMGNKQYCRTFKGTFQDLLNGIFRIGIQTRRPLINHHNLINSKRNYHSTDNEYEHWWKQNDEITLDFRSKARAKHSNCFWPAEIFEPLTSKLAFKPPRDCTNGAAEQRWIASQTCESLGTERFFLLLTKSRFYHFRFDIFDLPKCKFLGSKFSRMVPEKRNESWGTSAMRDRSTSNGRVAMSTVSIVIRPVWSGATRSKAATNEDLPAPVRPTIAIRLHDDVWNVTFCSDGCK